MSIIGSSWKEEYPSDDEVRKYNEITGEDFNGSKKDLEKRIEHVRNSNWSSRRKRKDLLNLEEELKQNKDESKTD